MRASFFGRVVVEDLGVVLRLAKRERERESKVDVPILRVVNLAILRGSFPCLSVLGKASARAGATYLVWHDPGLKEVQVARATTASCRRVKRVQHVLLNYI